MSTEKESAKILPIAKCYATQKINVVKYYDHDPSKNGQYCHTFTSMAGVSAQRTGAAAGASLFKSSSKMMSRNAKRHNKKRQHKKEQKQEDLVLLLESTLE